MNFLGMFIGIFIEGNIKKQKSYYQKCCSYLCRIGNINKIHLSKPSSSLTAIYKQNIPNIISFVNATFTSVNDVSAKLGVTNAAPNQAAAKLINKPDSTLSQGLVKNISIII